MKLVFKAFLFLLLAVLPFSLFAQDPTVILNYMKVTPGSESAYLEVEQVWKTINQKRIEAGLGTGWQLWQKAFAGADDPYQFIAIDWYENWEQALKPIPEGFWEEAMAGLGDDFFEKTMKSRVLVKQEVTHQVMVADNNEGGSLILVNRMKVKPGKGGKYVEFERDFAKPLFEEAIKQGQRAHWGVWQTFPFEEGQVRYTTVDGYKNAQQLAGTGGEDLLQVVHPDLTWEEVSEKASSLRTIASVELWELVDSFFPEAEE